MSLESTQPPADHDRERRDRLEALQVELREARQALTLVKAEAEHEHAALEKELAAEEARVAAANDRLFALRAADRAVEQRREAVEARLRDAYLDRFGEAPDRFDTFDDGFERDHEARLSRPGPWARMPAWGQALVVALALAAVVLLLSTGR